MRIGRKRVARLMRRPLEEVRRRRRRELTRRDLQAIKGRSIRRCRSAGGAGPAGVRTSTGTVAGCFDDAVTESFFATLETGLLDRHRFTTHAQTSRPR
ncbi:hypothetical protein [Microtetraspora niveoalba]|uniref:hypothetical protein n=1 Tax=Microtetraspora niveoalba TaxID=46175 RepID=UPI000A9F1D6A|nr:hypothetical protein [Microtetraspora niveoalba]